MDRKITALNVQKKNPSRINVYLDGEFAFGISSIVSAWLKIGQFLNQEKINELLEKDGHEVAFQRALHFLSYRPRSESEVRKKLSGLEYSANVIDRVIQHLITAGMLGDEQFARTWVENREAFRPRSRRLLRLELYHKGVSSEMIDKALENTANESELAYRLAQKYHRRLVGLEWKEFNRKLGSYLGRRGFSYGVISPVVRRIWSEILLEMNSNQSKENEEMLNG
jgi:regulatory protein